MNKLFIASRADSPEPTGGARAEPAGSALSGDPTAFGHRLRWAWVVVALSCCLVLVLAHSLRSQAHSSATSQFERRQAEITSAIHARMDTYEQALRGGLGLLEAAGQVTRGQWQAYVSALNLEQRYPGIRGLGFCAWVMPGELQAHVAAVRAEGFPDYRITPDAPRDAYAPVVFLEPFDDRNRQALGYDMWSDERQRLAMRDARDTGRTTISGRVAPARGGDAGNQAGFLMYLPHYRDLGPHQDVGTRRQALAGFVHATFRMGDMMKGVVGRRDDMRLQIHDGGAAEPARLMFDSHAGVDYVALAGPPRFEVTELLSIRGATWAMTFTTLPGFRRGNATDTQHLVVLVAGLTSCALFAFVVWSWGATRSRAMAMAADMVDSLDHQKAELLRSNAELEQFANVASHDLRSPLRNISFLITWLSDDHGAELSAGAREKLDDLAQCAARMDALLNSILAYSRLAKTEREFHAVDSKAIVAEAVGLIGPPPGFSVTVEGDLPDFEGSPPRMMQVFANLIGNAIKHHDRPEGTIVVSGARKRDYCEFRVRDDGPGIDPKFHARVFEMFKTLRSRDDVEGSGMGLAIVQKTIQQHGGRIWIEDNGAARGASFVFTVKRAPGND